MYLQWVLGFWLSHLLGEWWKNWLKCHYWLKLYAVEIIFSLWLVLSLCLCHFLIPKVNTTSRVQRPDTRNKWVRPVILLAMRHVVTFMCGYFCKGHLLVIFILSVLGNQHAASLPNTEHGQIQLASGWKVFFLMNPPTKGADTKDTRQSKTQGTRERERERERITVCRVKKIRFHSHRLNFNAVQLHWHEMSTSLSIEVGFEWLMSLGYSCSLYLLSSSRSPHQLLAHPCDSSNIGDLRRHSLTLIKW